MRHQIHEAIRQQRETFDQLRRQDEQWFRLRLVMSYTAVAILLAVFFVCTTVIFQSEAFPQSVVSLASATLFVDVVGFVFCVWKIAMKPTLRGRLQPITIAANPHVEKQRLA